MCGISGFFARENTWQHDIEIMNRRMFHRGPDAQEVWHDANGNFTLGHTRLSILDLSEAGRQPMQSHNGRYVIVLNGEIYNHQYLRDILSSEQNCTFRGHSDTEIFLEYISHYGVEKALDNSIGMFAFAVYDRQTKRLVLARDRIGEKPLYYGYIKGNLVFASDLGSIEAIGRENCTMDTGALTLYFRHGYIPAPYTIYKEIKKVNPGNILVFDYPYSKADIKEKKYWDIKEIAKFGLQHPFAGTYNDAVHELDRLMRQSISLQMVADVPVGAFLSGGIDSGSVASIMQRLSAKKIKTFTIGFEEKAFNEAIYAKEIAKHIGSDHQELYVGASDVIDVISRLPHIYSEPFADSSQLPTYLVSRLAKQNVTVSLSGDGGDELFGGYNSYSSIVRLWNKIHRIPYGIRKGVGKIFEQGSYYHERLIDKIGKYVGASSPENLYMRTSQIGWDEAVVQCGGAPSYAYSEYAPSFLKGAIEENIMLMDLLMYHPDDILVKVYRSAMAVSLESRIPLLDKNIIEFAWSLPLAYKRDGTIGKKVLRDVLYQYVPKELMDRPKKGFSIPVMQWVRNGQLRDWAETLLSPEKIRQEGILSPDVVKHTWENFKKHGWNASKIWELLMFEEWMGQR